MGDSSAVVGEPPVTSQHQQDQHQVSSILQSLSQVIEGQFIPMHVDVSVKMCAILWLLGWLSSSSGSER